MPDSAGLKTDCPRELRVDFLRGIAILVVLIDHIEYMGDAKLISLWTPISTGFSDGAEAFVFLSGTVFGIVYSRRLQQQGFLSVQKSMLSRSLSIYFTFLFATWIAICIAVACGHFSPTLAKWVDLSNGIFPAWLWSLPMCYQVYGLHILPFYVVLMPIAASLLWLHGRFSYPAWALSLGLYLAARNLPWLGLPQFPWGQEWYFNPFAWQFVFFLGLVSARSNAQIFRQFPPRIVGMIIAASVLILSLRVRWYSTGWPPEFQLLDSRILDWLNGWQEKTRPHPVRIIHFLCLAYLVACVLPPNSARVWRSILAAPIIKTGQHSLQVYAFGVVVMYFSIPILDTFHDVPDLVLLITFNSCLLSIGFAYLVARWKTIRKLNKLAVELKLTIEDEQS